MILLLSRTRPLTPAETRALPAGCQALDGKDGLIARAELDLPVESLLGFAVAMGRAVPDAVFVAQDGPPKATKAPEATEVTPVVTETNPWKLVAEGKLDDAFRLFASLGPSLTPSDRSRVRALLDERDPARVVFACRVLRVLEMRSVAVHLRGLLGHAHPDVRVAVIEALAELAGPSMAPAVAQLQNDPDAAVRAAAAAALIKLG